MQNMLTILSEDGINSTVIASTHQFASWIRRKDALEPSRLETVAQNTRRMNK